MLYKVSVISEDETNSIYIELNRDEAYLLDLISKALCDNCDGPYDSKPILGVVEVPRVPRNEHG